MTWMNLPEEYQKGEFVILPVAYEKDVTYGIGASKGAAAIIEASKHLEYYDDQFDCEPFEKGIELLDTVTGDTPEEMIEKVSSVVKEHSGKFVIGLGGDHAVTLGIVKDLPSDVSIIQFDAHADFRDSWNGSMLNHACVAKQLAKKHSILQIGIRSMDVDERRLLDSADNVHTISAYEFNLDKVKEKLSLLNEKVYVTIDVDAFDSSFIRNTGTPEPGGFMWNQVVDCLKLIFSSKKVVGADICEFAPKADYEAEAYALAKLVYKIMAMKVKKT